MKPKGDKVKVINGIKTIQLTRKESIKVYNKYTKEGLIGIIIEINKHVFELQKQIEKLNSLVDVILKEKIIKK